ncbi:MAG: ATP-binding protein [Candidatus Acidiferrales bacterium]
MPKIKVHEKALAHLSRGLYRSPASALRELVSNAWDANATAVRITTNYPKFFQIAIEDNGVGFTREELKGIMEGGIGNSQKRPQTTPAIHGRPVIGRLGIGLLGIAQICLGFRILSRPKNSEGFAARIRLYDLLKERLDRNDPDVTTDSGGTKEIEVGTYEIEKDFDPESIRFGTTILADDLHPTFVQAFQESVNFPEFVPPPKEWATALKIASRVRSLQELGDYWRLIWELSASCPVPYVNERAVPRKLIEDDQKRLTHYDFKVIIDGLELRKPVDLHRNPGGYTTFQIQPQHVKVYDRDLKFHGYIAVQEGLQLKPDELRGILLRIKNVAIGYYDPSLLDYRINQGPRSRWLTGEIIVDEGLENALNIDRDSFNRFHPEFRAVQTYVHKVLSTEIFPEVYRKIETRSESRDEIKSNTRIKNLRETISEVCDVRTTLRTQPTSKSENIAVATVEESAEALKLTIPNPESLKTKKTYRQLAASVLGIYEIALRGKSSEARRRTFAELLLKLLARW